MQTSRLRVSIVIPAYNEESYLARCLDAIARQTVRPFEVIVVDNNSTDETVAAARRYPFVKVLHEKRQGVAFARDTGFNAARGDVIGRVDGDTVMASDWVANVQEIFTDGGVMAATGVVQYHGLAMARVVNTLDLVARRYLARRLGRDVIVQGANMALRRSAWMAVRGDMCYRAGMHEDFDIGIHVTRRGGLVVFDERIRAVLGCRVADNTYPQFRAYCCIAPRTYLRHGMKNGREMYPVVWAALALYVPLRLLRRGYDGQKNRFSIRQLCTATVKPRVNPATYGDF